MRTQFPALPAAWPGALQSFPWSRWAARLPRWATVILVLAVAGTAADFTWLLLTPVETPQAGPARPAPVPGRRPAPGARYRDVANLHLFGQATAGRAAAPAGADLRETRLRLTLRGVFASDDPETSYAIIADERGQEDAYQPGDRLPGGARLHAVHADKVILERSGKLEKLLLPEKRLVQAAPAALPARRRPGRSGPPQPVAGGAAGQALRQVWQQLRSNPRQFWKQTRIEPVMGEGGTITGYRINHRNKALMRSLGLRPTDVITAVNGMPLNDPNSLFQLQGLLKELQPFTVTVLRDGQETTLDVQP